jgi:ribosomal protein L16/L10AE
MKNNQAIRLWSVKFNALGLRTISETSILWILADNLETASRKAKRLLKSNGGVNIHIKTVESHGTVDVF